MREQVSKSDYESKVAKKFIKDMESEGLLPFHYNGRYFWEGPAVVVKYLQDALSCTKVPCQYDSMGLSYVVYPKEKCKKKVTNEVE